MQRLQAGTTAVALLLFSGVSSAESIPNQAGYYAGQFGAGVSRSVLDAMYENRPTWVDVKPRSKAECMKESEGMVNPIYMKCRNGYQAYIVRLSSGEFRVLDERPLRY